MSQAAAEKAVCQNCQADVREGTAFCYNCGVPVAQPGIEEMATIDEATDVAEPQIDPKTKAALDDLAERLKLDEEEDKKLAKAAAERRKARVSQRKMSREFAWENSNESLGGPLLIATLLIAFFAAIVVLFTVFWK